MCVDVLLAQTVLALEQFCLELPYRYGVTFSLQLTFAVLVIHSLRKSAVHPTNIIAVATRRYKVRLSQIRPIITQPRPRLHTCCLKRLASA